jgi:hypothetical protein
MEIRGIDFTSAPSRRKPITLARARVEGDDLVITAIEAIRNFSAFEAMLAEPGPWCGGFDFPFGQPRIVVETLGWPLDWATYVGLVDERGKTAFEGDINRFIDAAPVGGKRPQRTADRGAGAHSPVKLHYQPVGRMFFQGAPRLLSADLNIPGLRETGAIRVAVEAYPALVARAAIGRISYKSDMKVGQTPERAAARATILRAIEGGLAPYPHTIRFSTPDDRTSCLEDGSGDRLDAVLAALQAAWACQAPKHGRPARLDPLEGFIADPGLGE